MTTPDRRDELIDRYLDGDIDDHAWQQACEEHGEELQQQLEQEQAIRSSISTLPQREMPAALQQSLKNIPSDQTNAAGGTAPGGVRRSLLFPIVNTVAAVAACLMVTFIAVYTSGALDDDESGDDIAMHDNSMPSMQAPAESRSRRSTANGKEQSGRKNEGSRMQLSDDQLMEEEAGGNAIIEALDADTDAVADDSPANELVEREQPTKTLKQKREKAENAPAAPANDRTRTMDQSAGTAASESTEREAIARDDWTAAADSEAKTRKQTDGKSDDMVLGTIQTDKAGAEPQQQEAGASDAISAEDMQAAVDEARSNLEHDQELKEAVARRHRQSKRKEQHEIIRQLAETQPGFFGEAKDDAGKEQADGEAPALGLQLRASHVKTHLQLGISMNEVPADWFARAILDLQVQGLDKDGTLIWTSAIKTHQVSDEVIELRSDGLPANGVRTLRLHSLGQQSPAIDCPKP